MTASKPHSKNIILIVPTYTKFTLIVQIDHSFEFEFFKVSIFEKIICLIIFIVKMDII